ncbi:FAD:protein FMN transferase [candidate division KSB1 bacterium]|nr:FAD:protein FMN transferase [candidate division KSB1 bacterium]
MHDRRTENIHRFSHAAMGSIFEIRICHADGRYAGSASVEAFRLLDQLEHDLSRFIANSDISRISNLHVGESTQVSYETYTCLRLCAEMHRLSRGVFDVTIGELYDCWLNPDKTLKSPTPQQVAAAKRRVGWSHLSLDEERYRVRMAGGPVRLDLGGFGKGYALDKMAELLADWEITTFVLNGGQSSMLIGDAPGDIGWPITISDPFDDYRLLRELYVANIAIGGSGLVKGRHIIDPRTAQPLENERAAWALAPTAATADGLSTTFMLLSLAEIADLCAQNPSCSAIIRQKNVEPLAERLVYTGSVKLYE